jgi:hypothetical protein
MLVVLPDSNSLFGRLIGTRPDRDWVALLECSKQGIAEVVVPEIVQWEIANQARREVHEQLARFQSASKKLRRYQVEAPLLAESGDVAEERVAAATEELRNQILLSGGRMAPIPDVSHAEVARRSLDQRRPFDGTDRGYRDTLLWHTALDLLREGNSVVLVSNDKAAFVAGGLDEQLHPDLAAELRTCGLSGELYLAKNLDRARMIVKELTSSGFVRIRQLLETDDVLADIMCRLARDALGRTLEEEELLHWGWSTDDLVGVRILEIKGFGQIRPHAVVSSDGGSLTAVVRLEVLAELDVRAYDCNDEVDAMAMPGPIHDIGVGLTDGLTQAYIDREVTLLGEIEICEKTGFVDSVQLTDVEIPRKLIREGQLELGHPFGDLVE